jgi:hypothetical protein
VVIAQAIMMMNDEWTFFRRKRGYDSRAFVGLPDDNLNGFPAGN